MYQPRLGYILGMMSPTLLRVFRCALKPLARVRWSLQLLAQLATGAGCPTSTPPMNCSFTQTERKKQS